MADEVLHAGVRSITDLMVVPGLINLDFADVKTIMNNMGRAMTVSYTHLTLPTILLV